MDPEFWHERWAEKQIGFHQAAGNGLLAAHLEAFDWPAGARVFVPLCGKTADIGWLRSKGFSIAGAELSRVAVEELFAELGVTPEITEIGALTRFHAEEITIYAGDFFDLTGDILGPVDAVYDRAALIALPPDMRRRYARHLIGVTVAVPQALITLDYDQELMSGPPFSVSPAEIATHYKSQFQVTELARRAADGPVARVGALERICTLQPLNPAGA